MEIHMRCIALVAALLSAGAPAMAADTVVLAGNVIDLGARDAAASGISGVAVTVRNASGKEVASGLTDAQGRYRIEVARSADPRTVSFDKLGYQTRPTVRPIADAAALQRAVKMVRESASATYYQTIAARTAERELPPAEREERVALVVDLPPADKARVVEEVKKLAAAPTLQQIQVAEHSKAIASSVRTRLASDAGLDMLTVNADATSGVVQLSGAVDTPAQKVKAAEVARSVQGVSGVKNQLSVRGVRGLMESIAGPGAAATAAAASGTREEASKAESSAR